MMQKLFDNQKRIFASEQSSSFSARNFQVALLLEKERVK
jgi:hypothetical protein